MSSLAAELNEVGNAYYSLAKSILNKSIKILNKEQKINIDLIFYRWEWSIIKCLKK